MPPKVHNLIFEKWYRFCAFSFLIYGERVSGDLPGRIPTERMNAVAQRTSSPDPRVYWKEKPAAPRRQDFPKAFPFNRIGCQALIHPFLFLPVNRSLDGLTRCSFIGRYRSHRRSGNGTARKANRTAFFGQPSGWLFFCRAERRKTYRTGCGRERNSKKKHDRRNNPNDTRFKTHQTARHRKRPGKEECECSLRNAWGARSTAFMCTEARTKATHRLKTLWCG